MLTFYILEINLSVVMLQLFNFLRFFLRGTQIKIDIFGIKGILILHSLRAHCQHLQTLYSNVVCVISMHLIFYMGNIF